MFSPVTPGFDGWLAEDGGENCKRVATVAPVGAIHKLLPVDGSERVAIIQQDFMIQLECKFFYNLCCVSKQQVCLT
jgi:hypothetical protein